MYEIETEDIVNAQNKSDLFNLLINNGKSKKN